MPLNPNRTLEDALALLPGRGPDPAVVDATRKWLTQQDHHLIAFDDDAYPRPLREIPDPPPLLHAIGDVRLLNSQCLGIVGSRNATTQGVRDARDFARNLSERGLCIVSGLALGVDAAAHTGGLEGRSSSIAVLGTGADVMYPAGNAALYGRLRESGCIVTEYCLHTPPLRGNFPRRNRLISGLARGVLVVEAGTGSGSLLTARLAAHQNREVFAMPGSIHNTKAKGCHELIREGAKLVDRVDDILVELRMADRGRPAGRRAERPECTDEILAAMGRDPVSLDQVIMRSGMRASDCAARLSLLELAGRVAALDGGLFQRLDSPS